MKRLPYATTLSEKIIKKLKYTAVDENRKANEIIEKALNDYFKKREGKEEIDIYR